GKDNTGESVTEGGAVAPKLQYCDEDPGNSLYPRWTVRRSLTEPLIVHTALEPRDRNARIGEILQQVGLPPTHLELYPHELSGGQQRRDRLPPFLTRQSRIRVLEDPTSRVHATGPDGGAKIMPTLHHPLPPCPPLTYPPH